MIALLHFWCRQQTYKPRTLNNGGSLHIHLLVPQHHGAGELAPAVAAEPFFYWHAHSCCACVADINVNAILRAVVSVIDDGLARQRCGL